MAIKAATLKKIYAMRDAFCKQHFKKRFYSYQWEPSNAIIRAAICWDGEEFYVEISRQAGKTEMIVLTITFLIIHIKDILRVLNKPMVEGYNIVLAAPQREQAKTDFDRIEEYLDKIKDTYGFTFDESNRTTLKLSNGNTIFCFPVTITSNVESKTAHLIIGEEMQDIPDAEWDKSIVPMGTATNASIVHIGTAGYKICKFYKGIESGKNVFRYDCHAVIKERRRAYDKDGNEYHLNYERYVHKRIEALGEHNPEIQTQYFLKWQLERGMWLTPIQFEALIADGKDGKPHYPVVTKDLVNDITVGEDVAKESDVTFTTAMREEGYKEVIRRVPIITKDGMPGFKKVKVKAPLYRVLNWFMINGTLYQEQWEATDVFLENYNVQKMNIDSTGVGDATGDYYLRKYNSWSWDMLKDYEKLKIRGIVMPVKFTASSKNIMYTNLDQVIREGRLFLPDPATLDERQMQCFQRFKIEATNAIREWKGSLLNVRHPSKAKGEAGDVFTDDSVDSLALMFIDPGVKCHKIGYALG